MSSSSCSSTCTSSLGSRSRPRKQKHSNQHQAKLKLAAGLDFDALVVNTSRQLCARSQLEDANSPPGQIGVSAREQPGEPRRPMNAFMVWAQVVRRELHSRYSNVQNAPLSKALGRVWRIMDFHDKQPFVDKANLLKADHKRIYPNYRYQPRRTQDTNRLKAGNLLVGFGLDVQQSSVCSQPRPACAPSYATGNGPILCPDPRNCCEPIVCSDPQNCCEPPPQATKRQTCPTNSNQRMKLQPTSSQLCSDFTDSQNYFAQNQTQTQSNWNQHPREYPDQHQQVTSEQHQQVIEGHSCVYYQGHIGELNNNMVEPVDRNYLERQVYGTQTQVYDGQA